MELKNNIFEGEANLLNAIGQIINMNCSVKISLPLRKLVNELQKQEEFYFAEKKAVLGRYNYEQGKSISNDLAAEITELMNLNFEIKYEPIEISSNYMIEKDWQLSAVTLATLEKNNIIKIVD